jgi:hypothetical protein
MKDGAHRFRIRDGKAGGNTHSYRIASKPDHREDLMILRGYLRDLFCDRYSRSLGGAFVA